MAFRVDSSAVERAEMAAAESLAAMGRRATGNAAALEAPRKSSEAVVLHWVSVRLSQQEGRAWNGSALLRYSRVSSRSHMSEWARRGEHIPDGRQGPFALSREVALF